MEDLRKSIAKEIKRSKNESDPYLLATQSTLEGIVNVLTHEGKEVTPLHVFLTVSQAIQNVQGKSAQELYGLLRVASTCVSHLSVPVQRRMFSPICESVHVVFSNKSHARSPELVVCCLRLVASLCSHQDPLLWSEEYHRSVFLQRLQWLSHEDGSVRQAALDCALSAVRRSPRALLTPLLQWASRASHPPILSSCAPLLSSALSASSSSQSSSVTNLIRQWTPLLQSMSSANASQKIAAPTLEALWTALAAVISALPHNTSSLQPVSTLWTLCVENRPPVQQRKVLLAWTEAVASVAEVVRPFAQETGKVEQLMRTAEALVTLLGTLSSSSEEDEAFEAKLNEVIGKAVRNLLMASVQASDANDEKAVAIAESTLHVSRRSTWNVVGLPLIPHLAGSMGPVRAERRLPGVLAILCALWERAAASSPLRSAIERCLAGVCHVLGGERWEHVCPSNLPPETTQIPTRPWLIPIAARGLCGTQLKFFAVSIVPRARKLQAMAQTLSPNDRKNSMLVAHQMYALFAPLCIVPRDFCQVWPRMISNVLGSLTKDQTLRPIMAAGLSNLACSFRQVARPGEEEVLDLSNIPSLPSVDEANQSLACFGSSASQIIPCLFNAYLAAGDSVRNQQAVLTALKDTVSVSPRDVTNSFFREVLTRALKTGDPQDSDKLHALASCFIPVLDGSNAERYLEVVAESGIGDKQLWRIVAQLCSKGSAKTGSGLVHRKMPRLLELLSQRAWDDTHSNGAHRHRLEVWRELILNADDAEQVTKVARTCMPEIVMGAREARKCLEESQSVLEALVEVASLDIAIPSPDEIVSRYLGAFLAVPDTSVIAGALSSIIYMLKIASVDNSTYAQLRSLASKLLQSESHELVGTTLNLLMVLVKQWRVPPHDVPPLMRQLWDMKPQMQSRCRRQVKVLVERLIRKMGPNMILDAAPNEEARHLVTVLAKKKRRETKKNKKEKEASGNRKDKKKQQEKKQREGFLDPETGDLLSVQSLGKAAVKADDEEGGGWGEDFPLDQETGKPVINDPEDERFKRKGFVGDGEDFVPDDIDDDDDDDDGNSNDEDEVVDEDQGEEKDAKKKKTNNKKAKKDSKVIGGEMYKAKKGEGDVKKGKYDPFSYVKLDPKNLNRRRTGHTAEQYSGLFSKKKRSIKTERERKRGLKQGGRYYSK